ncbi:2Fe-2S iron-sulfur cluster-binding protein [Aureivirga marina]|uniref:2Fe-2S iron-sulfur cluster-binding protein n=1 Tax=Aureivirga marina TaxID=1182451 RepID=UPI0018C94DEB|nr:2Fe-2S iron-sulfur cluster-binding protein [Aureivirga marina]
MQTKNTNDTLTRVNDVFTPESNVVHVEIDNIPCKAYEGESVLSVLEAHDKIQISKNDHQQVAGAYCGMGICFCCTVSINNLKRRACKTIVKEGMKIDTQKNTEDIVEAQFLENIKNN